MCPPSRPSVAPSPVNLALLRTCPHVLLPPPPPCSDSDLEEFMDARSRRTSLISSTGSTCECCPIQSRLAVLPVDLAVLWRPKCCCVLSAAAM